MQSSPAHNPNSDPFTPGGGGGGMRDSCDSVIVKTKSEEDEDELSFMKKLNSADWERYCFQKDMIRCRPPFCMTRTIYEMYKDKYDSYANQSFPIVQPRDLDGGVKHYSFDELMQMTCCFRSTLICYTMFGTLHRGTIQTESGSLDVLVKTWEYFYPLRSDYRAWHHTHRIHDELDLLRDHEIRSHRNVVKLIGFHCARRLAVIYEDRHTELLEKIIPTDAFSWDDRMKVATDIAGMLGAFHDKGLVHGGVNSKYIMVDKEKCPVVFDFRLLSYCENRYEYERHVGQLYSFHCKHLDGPPWSMKHDIFAYGILLFELISTKVYPMFKMSSWTEEDFCNCHLSDPKTSAVDDSFCVDEDTATEFTKLAVDCLGVNSDEQPTMQCIVRVLKDLKLWYPTKKRQKISD